MLPNRLNQVIQTLVASTIAFVAVTVTTLTVTTATFANAIQANGGINSAGTASTTALIVGQGTSIDKHLHTTATVDPNSMAGLGSSTSSVVTLSGASTGDTVIVTRPSAWAGQPALIHGYVSATDAVTLNFVNVTSTALDLASGVAQIDIWSH